MSSSQNGSSQRRDGEDFVIRHFGSDPTLAWAMASLVSALLMALLGYLLGGWSLAVTLFVVSVVGAALTRAYAKWLQRRREGRRT